MKHALGALVGIALGVVLVFFLDGRGASYWTGAAILVSASLVVGLVVKRLLTAGLYVLGLWIGIEAVFVWLMEAGLGPGGGIIGFGVGALTGFPAMAIAYLVAGGTILIKRRLSKKTATDGSLPLPEREPTDLPPSP